jgi:hypothetical protein
MDWLWPIYEEHVRRRFPPSEPEPDQAALQAAFMASLGESTATLWVMEPVGTTIRFMGLGRWPLAKVPDLLTDPNDFIAAGWGGGKFKVNFHRGDNFIGTHNFRTWGDERWREMEEVEFD